MNEKPYSGPVLASEREPYAKGHASGEDVAQRVLDVGPGSTRGYSGSMRLSLEMPPAEDAPMTRDERVEWLRGFAAGIESVLPDDLPALG